jgi:hypothetical protein
MKEIKISFTISIPLKQTDIHWIEEELLKKREEVFIEAMKEVIKGIEDEAIKSNELCSDCRLPLVRNGREPKKIKTLLGTLQIKRARLRCHGCGKDIYPLDEAMGIEGDCVTIGVKERALWAAVEVSYEKSSEFLKKFTGLEVSRNKIHRMSLEEGKRIEKWEEERRFKVFEEGKEAEEAVKEDAKVFYIQVDGTGVNDRESKEWMECKVGASFKERVLISKNRVWLMDKKSYASIEDAEGFGEKFYLDCRRHGVEKAKKVFFIGDGARWIRNLKDNYFPEATGILDIWHLEREFKKVFGDEGRVVVEELKGLALNGEAKRIIERLWQEGLKTRGEMRRRVKDLIEYVRNNYEWIQNIPLIGGYGSGPIEKTVDITVARRFKKRGMSWYKRGANPLLRLRLLKLNGEWDTYWQERRKEFIRYAA